jgi:hypothetical protein
MKKHICLFDKIYEKNKKNKNENKKIIKKLKSFFNSNE